MKSITLVTGSEMTRKVLVAQLKEYLYDIADIKSYAIDEGIDHVISDELVILSSYLVKEELIEANLLDTNCEMIVSERTLSYDHIDQIVLLPRNTEVLFVNDVKETVYEGIEILKDLGIDYIKYIPYYPGKKEPVKKVDIAITPGEADKVPKFVKKVYDIGPRLMDFITITKILNKLGILDQKAGQFSQKYLQKIIDMSKRIALSTNEISDLNEHLSLVINGLNDGLLVYDVNGIISVFNENLKKILNLAYPKVIGRSIKDVIYNKKLLTFLMNKELEEERVIDIDGVEVVVNKFQLPENNSIVATFKNAKETIEKSNKLRRELINRGYFAKYSFDDIIGKSFKINRVKGIAKKLAKSDLTILIEGESGTGKELFASAIHNESRRKQGPFLAVNFSALPDELIESELFGYEEGAFTGAKKGGKAGLFEQADGGTIFLDEIGDISMKVQTRLLRVLQEKEVMRIGGTEIKSVDVRVIAATNKDLVNMVNERKFREDLYYRLKMGYLKIPPLRERKEDLIELMNYFIKIETTENIKISDEVIKELLKYDWYGNVRELKNTLSYMLAVREGNTLTLKDIPDRGFFKRELKDIQRDSILNQEELTDELKFILEKIYQFSKKGEIVGREKLAKETKYTKYEMTKYQMRSRLNKLERMGLIIKKKGKHGTILSNKGEEVIMGLMT
ncbi:sigma 54-interacting transcriptional regulator [Caldisalinibacter kiritimatiensis]|nr:sigma 54-interacting transcriptional regulator [Caldisalinibacter kiritimatiensis]